MGKVQAARTTFSKILPTCEERFSNPILQGKAWNMYTWAISRSLLNINQPCPQRSCVWNGEFQIKLVYFYDLWLEAYRSSLMLISFMYVRIRHWCFAVCRSCTCLQSYQNFIFSCTCKTLFMWDYGGTGQRLWHILWYCLIWALLAPTNLCR